MIQPLALVAYEKLLPGSQLANRMRDLGYRVEVLSEINELAPVARSVKPMLVVIDLATNRSDATAAIRSLRDAPDTQHIPVLAFGPEKRTDLHELARSAGATVVTADTTILPHLEQFVEQALHLD